MTLQQVNIFLKEIERLEKGEEEKPLEGETGAKVSKMMLKRKRQPWRH